MEQDNQQITSAIKNTICWFDLFDYPLTTLELHRYLPLKISLAELNNYLIPNNWLATKNGFWFLAGRSNLLTIRSRRYNYADRKIKKLIIFFYLFAKLPWIKTIALTNLIGANNLRSEGDIDLLIITAKNRVWLSRFLITGFLKVGGLRPSAQKSQDTFCTSFFISEDNLNLEKMRLVNDNYFTAWLAGLRPIFDKEIYAKFIAENSWLKQELPNYQATNFNRHFSHYSYTNNCSKINFNFLDWLEQKVKIFQLNYLPTELKNINNLDTRVITSDTIIKLHANDRRQDFAQKLQAKMASL